MIIGGMSSYNSPEMSYMVDLFDKNIIKYIAIPFDEQVYVRYLEGLINCDLSLKGYSKACLLNFKKYNQIIVGINNEDMIVNDYYDLKKIIDGLALSSKSV